MQIDLGAPLPIFPPPEEDELISSWLDRIARFYGVPAWELFGLTRGRRVLSLSSVDLGTSEPALAKIGARLGITRVKTHKIDSKSNGLLLLYPPNSENCE